MRRVPILADLEQISDPFIATGLKRPEMQDQKPYLPISISCDSCRLPLHLKKYRVDSARAGQCLLCGHVHLDTGLEIG